MERNGREISIWCLEGQKLLKIKLFVEKSSCFICGYNHFLCLFKNSLGILGIPFSDVMRIFSAILLLGNIEFIEGTGLELDIIGNNGK